MITQSLCITENHSEAYYIFSRDNASFIEKMYIDNKCYYHVYKYEASIKTETETPIYEQILQMEAIELHKLAEIIKSKKGTVLDLSTDKVICCFPDNKLPFELDEENIVGYYFDKNKKN